MLTIQPPSKRQKDELYDLVSKVFSDRGYFRFLRYCREEYFEGSSYDWDASRVAVMDGRLVGHVGVWRYGMRIGSARLQSGGIGAVLTHPEHRKRGIAAKVMRATVKAMRQGGYDTSVLFGIRNFYDRFGFTQVWPMTSMTVELGELEGRRLDGRLVAVPLTSAMTPGTAIMRLYEADNATRTGTVVRPIYTGVSSMWFDRKCHEIRSGRSVVGYVITVVENEDLLVQEAGGISTREGLERVIAALASLAREAKCRRIRTRHLSCEHPLCRALRRLTTKTEIQSTQCGHAMGAVVNLRGCLSAMVGELTARLARSAMRDYSGTLELLGADESITLAIGGGTVGVVRGRRGGPGRTPREAAANRIDAGQEAARVILGSEAPATLALQGMTFTGEALPLAEALFPAQSPMHYALDGF